MAQIIRLDQYRTSVKGKNGGVNFPQLYRANGFYWDSAVEGEREITPSNRPAPTFSTLSEYDKGGLANVTHVAMNSLDPEIDDGWMLIRHHRMRSDVEGYLDALSDFVTDESGINGKFFQTEEGIFSLIRRPFTPGRPNKLIIYVTRIPDPNMHHPIGGQFSNGWVDHRQVFYPDGSSAEDPDICLPPEKEEED